MSLTRTLLLATAAAGTILTGAAKANTYTFFSPLSSPEGQPAQGTATITTSANTVTFTLTNTSTGILSSGQFMSGLNITLSPTPVGTPTNFQMTQGDYVQLIAPNQVSAPLNPQPILNWGATGTDPYTIQAANIGQQGGLITPDAVNGVLQNATFNPSVINANPYIEGPATFQFTLTGVTAQTIVTNAVFLWGTSLIPVSGCTTANCQPSNIPGVPEPTGLAVFGAGLAAIGLIRHLGARRREQESATA